MPYHQEIREISFYVGTLVAPQLIGTQFLGENKPKKEVNKIHDTLYKFSISKVDKLLEDKYIGILLKYFISASSCIERIISANKVSEESYRTAFSMIEGRATAAIEGNTQNDS